jgi:hypothetical protein
MSTRRRATPRKEKLMAGFYERAFNRNQLYAVAVPPPVIFLLTGHVVLGVVFVLCVVGARFSRPRPRRAPRKRPPPAVSNY